MVIPHYYVPFESGNIYVHRVTAPGNCRAVIILPGRSMSGRNFWHFDPGTGTTHAEQLADQGVDVYMVDALGFGNSTGVSRSDYNRIYFAEQIAAVIETLPEYNNIAALGFCNTTMVPLVLAAQGVVNRAVVMSPTVFDTAWCQQNPAWIRLWQRTATESGYWSTSLDLLIEQQLLKVSDGEIGEPQRVDSWYKEMQRLTQAYTSYNLDLWTAPRTWWLDRINWPLLHDNHGFDADALAGVPILFTRGEHDVDVPQDWFDRACEYFAVAELQTYIIPGATHFALWEHGYQAAVDRVGEFLLA